MNFVIDASVVAAWILEDEESLLADRVIHSLSLFTAITPSLWSLEISNILLSAERRRRITTTTRQKIIKVVQDFGIIEEPYSQAHVFSHVLPLAAAHGLSAYDAFYLELASRLSIPLATLDNKLRAAAKAEGVQLFDGKK